MAKAPQGPTVGRNKTDTDAVAPAECGAPVRYRIRSRRMRRVDAVDAPPPAAGAFKPRRKLTRFELLAGKRGRLPRHARPSGERLRHAMAAAGFNPEPPSTLDRRQP
jgi:hypothetical protein